jgi:hypothetical protein
MAAWLPVVPGVIAVAVVRGLRGRGRGRRGVVVLAGLVAGQVVVDGGLRHSSSRVLTTRDSSTSWRRQCSSSGSGKSVASR